ncbi:GNAT family N-acetyltransferase [Oceanirhabdus sp. W0125-5]|uniref:GNAT family N-acetyltransferase n=1 Tax=Oceanirhabdus sp. W0125-5 TaxID=2999116 RepID=UPI0022F2D51F|nr:GNAT family N-acetyltransferase [Oceanirhabdus sp. W0125-5]WBW96290.1 GNAT family N-acetyltransferase [Oceanirhabdus sp. W0125-5]
MKNISIKEYKKEYKGAINDLISDNSFVRDDIIGCLDRWPECGILIEDGEKVLGVGVFTGVNKKTSMTLYVKPSKRREGIGTIILKALEEKMRNAGVEEAVCDFKENDVEQLFIYKNGYKQWFKSNYMTYTGGEMTIENHDIVKYEDEYYDECQKVLSESFHKMRLSVGMESTPSLPSEEERQDYKENADNIFVLRDNSIIVAVLRLDGDEIDALAVDEKHRGKGYGKALVGYGVNKVLSRGCTKVPLWVVEGNKAKYLYDKLGFIKERTHEFVCKSIK